MTGYYLLDNPNPAAPERGDGRYWGHASMLERPTCIGVHTAESIADELGDDLGAENIARYFTTTTTPSSYHTVVDSDSAVALLPAGLDDLPVHTAFHAPGINSRGLGLSFATRADSWATVSPAWAARILNRGVNVAAAWCARWDIPPVRITLAQAEAGVRGFIGHADVNPGWRTDPGAEFPWDRFLSLVAAQLDLGPSTTEDIMNDTQDARLAAVHRDVVDGHLAGTIVAQLDTRLNNIVAKLDAIETRLGAIEGGEVPTAEEIVLAAARRIIE